MSSFVVKRSKLMPYSTNQPMNPSAVSAEFNKVLTLVPPNLENFFTIIFQSCEVVNFSAFKIS